MAYSHSPFQTITSLSYDSDQDSIFYVSEKKKNHLTSRRLNLNTRIVGKKNIWNRKQQERYLDFLKNEFDLLQSRSGSCQALRIYQRMAKSIRTKNQAECRIHHNRAMLRHLKLQEVIRNTQRRLKAGPRSLSKMQQYKGLQVDLEQEEPIESTTNQKQLWDCLEGNCWTYYQIQDIQEPFRLS